MNNAIETMLRKCNPRNNAERESAAREILQEIALAGLSRLKLELKRVAILPNANKTPNNRSIQFNK